MGIRHGVVAFCAGLVFAGAALAECRADSVDVKGEFGSARFTVELALKPQEQARGLMFRKDMATMSGMLFVYQREQSVAFWMRNTLIPLDMIFIDDEGVIVKVHANAIPGDETPIPSGEPARAVLEINGGMAEQLGIDAGDIVRTPIMPQDIANWRCEDASQ